MRGVAALLFSISLLVASGRPASALPVFAHRYGMTCAQCHTTIPHLNNFGEAFASRGFTLPNPRGVFPIAAKVNLAYGSDSDPSGLPKAVVDEVELLSGGAIGKSTSYFVEQYVIDGGRPGLTRDAWLQFRHESGRAKIGQFELPLPVEVESDRDTLSHYALYDQTVGINTFSFFDPRLGFDFSTGSEDAGFSAHVLALNAYDRQTPTPRSGTDYMATLAKDAGEVTLSTYRYQGQRNFAVQDRFWRQGFAANVQGERLSLQAVLQTGNDTSADGAGMSAQSSGGFLQAQYHFNDWWSAVARYEGTNDTLGGMQRQFVLSAITRPRRNMRFTLEGMQSRGHNALTAALLFAY